jgi:sugar O-acyltransferase (sialic acid O-acetyltransferase NeuD family)
MQLLIFGAGAQGRVVLDILRAGRPDATISFVDEDRELWGREVDGACVAGGVDTLVALRDEPHGIVVAIGKPSAHLEIAARLAGLGLRFTDAVHPDAVIAPSAVVGAGTVIGPGVVVDTDSHVGEHCVVNPGVIVAHDCTIGDGALLGPGVNLGGRVTIEEAAFVGIGTTVVARVTIGKGAVVGAASTVVDDVAPRVMVLGTPARLVFPVDESFDWSRLL